MSEENVEIVRSVSEAWNRGDYAKALESVDADIEVEAALGGTFDGTYQGVAGLGKFLGDFWGNFDDFRTEIEEYIPAGDDVVFEAHHYRRGKSSGVEAEMRNWQVCTLRDGKIVRYRLFRSKPEAVEAAGLSE